MSRLGRAVAWLFPSVSPADQSIVLAAMEGRTITPVSVSLWSPHPHHSWEFTDAALAQLVTDWQKEPQA